MAIQATLRLNMTGLAQDPAEEAKRYKAAIDMAVYAEERGFQTVNLEEHHCAENGWLPAPLTLAAMIIARTKRVRVNVGALLVTLYDPIRLAEDIAILDLVSGGRFSFVAGLGYRPIEYHATGKPWEERGRLMDECLETLLKAWTGEPFDYRGQRIRVTPSPLTRPHPFFLVGGMSPVAARRAARFGLPFHPPMERPDLEIVYTEELARQGKRGLFITPGAGNTMLVVDESPEEAWRELSPYFLRELQEYSDWKHEGVVRPGEEAVRNVADLRQQERFTILDIAGARQRFGPEGSGSAVVHPLAGGIPLARAWEILERFSDALLGPSPPTP
ncbi:MAG: LLM class flavin-dependent oxidoreductase [Myxococcota bacterium]|nr:LLM class flavin-dependent oxidoreductase [Myxococcota bacterium]